MAEGPWYKDVPESEEDKLYEESMKKVKSAVQQGLSFEQAAGLVEVKDEALKTAILDDSLKVLIAELHFMAGQSLNDLAKKLKLPLERLERAKKEMLQDVEGAAIEKWKEESGGGIGHA